MRVRRREFIAGVPALGFSGLLGACAATGTALVPTAEGVYQVDDPKAIMDAARAIIGEDYIGVLVTIDAQGMPRARPVGVAEPADDWSIWIATRRGSRKTQQIEANPKAALHFGFDDTPNNHADSYYASFSGLASVHTDPETIAAHGPSETYRSNWSDYPNDLALIRFRPERLEVMGKGILPSEDLWQPQGVFLR